MVDATFLIETAIGVAILALIALIGSNFATIVSIVSHIKQRMAEEGEARRAYRQRVYGYAHMSSKAVSSARTIIEPREPDIRTPDANHLEPEEPAVREPAREPINLRQLPKQDLIVLLAVQRDEEEKYIYSSNDITKFVGGTAADVKALIAAVRAEKPIEQAARLGHLPRPANGWRT